MRRKTKLIRLASSLTGTGQWLDYKTFQLGAGMEITHQFPAEFQAYWIRFVSADDTEASAQLTYK